MSLLVRNLLIGGVLMWLGLAAAYLGPFFSRQAGILPEDFYVKKSAERLVKGDWLRAQTVINRGLTHFPRCANLYFNLGLSYYLSGDYPKARATFEKLIDINPYYPDVHYLLGRMYQTDGNYPCAKQEFIRELNVNPGNPRAWDQIQQNKRISLHTTP